MLLPKKTHPSFTLCRARRAKPMICEHNHNLPFRFRDLARRLDGHRGVDTVSEISCFFCHNFVQFVPWGLVRDGGLAIATVVSQESIMICTFVPNKKSIGLHPPSSAFHRALWLCALQTRIFTIIHRFTKIHSLSLNVPPLFGR